MLESISSYCCHPKVKPEIIIRVAANLMNLISVKKKKKQDAFLGNDVKDSL